MAVFHASGTGLEVRIPQAQRAHGAEEVAQRGLRNSAAVRVAGAAVLVPLPVPLPPFGVSLHSFESKKKVWCARHLQMWVKDPSSYVLAEPIAALTHWSRC